MAFTIKLGRLAENAARWIDDSYLSDPHSWLTHGLQLIKTRLIFLAFFPILTGIDFIVSGIAAAFFNSWSFFSSDQNTKNFRKEKAKELFELCSKSLLGLLGTPLGFINPKLVAFYFVPPHAKKDFLQSGGKLYEVQTTVHEPKSVTELQALVKDAISTNKKISVIGRGMSQGKQFLPNDSQSIAISLKHLKQVTVDPKQKTATVQAGASWGDIQIAADKEQLAVKVMQASNIFSVGGSIGTNIHGWNKGGTVASTIRSLRIINAKGEIQIVTPEDELFGYILGGFGQFGIVIEAELELTDNELLEECSREIDPADYINYFNQTVKANQKNRMHLYRLSLDPKHLLEQGVAVNYNTMDDSFTKKTPRLSLEKANGTRLERILINLVRRLPILRKFYWKYEKSRLLKNKGEMTTNTIMQPAINAMLNDSMSESEWLQEYFLPEENLEAFLKELGKLLMDNSVVLLNATVRYVKQDTISKMGYANDGDRFAVVLCFNQSLAPSELITAKKWIKQSIDLTLKHKGTYYLPYQQFASTEQFKQCYPTAEAVYQKKQEIDPSGVFSSGFSSQYLAPQKPDRNYYQTIMQSENTKKEFGKFLDNVLERVDQQKYFELITDILTYANTRFEIYTELKNRIGEIMPSALGSAKRILHSLSSIKGDLSTQVATLMQNAYKIAPEIHGMIEIGYPGRFVRDIKKKIHVHGQITVVNYEESATDIIQCGFPRPYDRFVPMNDYASWDTATFQENSVDLITCFIGLHHIPEDKLAGFLSSIHRALRPGGSFLLVDHDVQDDNTRDYANLAHSVYNAVMGVSIDEEMGETRNFKSLNEWKEILETAGFSVEMGSNSPCVRDGDPTKNSMIRFVKKRLEAKAVATADNVVLSTTQRSILPQFENAPDSADQHTPFGQVAAPTSTLKLDQTT